MIRISFSVILLAGFALALDAESARGQLPGLGFSVVAEIQSSADLPSNRVVGLAMDSAGRLYIGDGAASQVLLYDGDGQFTQTIAVPGGGSRTLGAMNEIQIGPDERLYVSQLDRVSVFERNPTTGVLDVLAETRGPPRTGKNRRLPGKIGLDRRSYSPDVQARAGELPQHRYLISGEGADPNGDPLPVPDYAGMERTREAYYLTNPNTGRMLYGLSALPFEPVPSWDLTPEGTVLGGDGAEGVLYETDAGGDTVRVMRIEFERTPIPAAEMVDSLFALQTRLAAAPVPFSEIVGLSPRAPNRELPNTYPAYLSVRVSPIGEIWVERWPDAPGTRRFQILSRTGETLAWVEFEAPFEATRPLVLTRDFAYGIVADLDAGVEQVVRAPVRAVAGL